MFYKCSLKIPHVDFDDPVRGHVAYISAIHRRTVFCFVDDIFYDAIRTLSNRPGVAISDKRQLLPQAFQVRTGLSSRSSKTVTIDSPTLKI